MLAANEELQSINEEYRSTAEELETSKEEQQSLNEELQTINAELKSRFDSVSTAHNDLQNLMAVTEIGTLFLDAALRIKLFTPVVANFFHITNSDVGRVITDFTHRLRYPELRDDIYRVLRSLATVEKEVTAEDSEQWLDVHIRPYRTVDDHIEGVVLTFIDVTARREAEKQLLLVTQELSHRVRNILAVVEALAEQTNAGDINTYRTAFSARIHALAEAHSLLLKSAWREADLRQLLAQTVDPYPHERFSVKGPQLLLSPKQTVGIRLILHELATNAVKYGALSTPPGRVAVSWEITNSAPGGDRTVHLVWEEHDGPVVHPPERTGFGGRLIVRASEYELGGKTELDYAAEGLTCRINFPVRTP